MIIGEGAYIIERRLIGQVLGIKGYRAKMTCQVIFITENYFQCFNNSYLYYSAPR